MGGCNSFCSTSDANKQIQPDTESLVSTRSNRTISSPKSIDNTDTIRSPSTSKSHIRSHTDSLSMSVASISNFDNVQSIQSRSDSITETDSNDISRIPSLPRAEMTFRSALKDDFKQAVIEGNDTMVMYLHGEHPSMDFFNILYKNGDTPLHSAARKRRWNVIEYMLECNASPNTQNDEGDTALHIAARKNDMKTIGILHKFGGDGNIENNHSETAISIAHELHYDNIVEFLGGLPEDVTSPSMETPMPSDSVDIVHPIFRRPSATKSKSKSVSKSKAKRTSIGHRGTTLRVNYFADDILSHSKHTLNKAKNEEILTSMNTNRLNDITNDIFDDITKTIKINKATLMELCGWMDRKQSVPPYSWLKRWVIVDYGYLLWSDRQITINPDKGVDKREKKRWNKCIPITDIEEVIKVTEGKTQRKFKIRVKGNGIDREYLFKAQSKKWRDKWVKNLSEHVKILHQESIYASNVSTQRLI